MWVYRFTSPAGKHRADSLLGKEVRGLPGVLHRRLSGKESACQWHKLPDSWLGISWSRKWQPTPVFLLGKSHGQRSLVGDSPWGPRELYMTGLRDRGHRAPRSLDKTTPSSIPIPLFIGMKGVPHAILSLFEVFLSYSPPSLPYKMSKICCGTYTLVISLWFLPPILHQSL